MSELHMLLEGSNSLDSDALECPGGPLPLDSALYIERPPIESLVYQEIQKSGAVIRIQGASETGKSSLLNRLLDHAKGLDYQVVTINFQEADCAVFSGIDKFLRWFSVNISRRLNLENRLDQFWDDEIGSKVSCTYYFEDYLLAEIDQPIVLALNEVNFIFEYPDIARDFFPLLRYWHEQAKQVEAFQQLRLVIIHSTEIYIPLQIHQSPFNVGLPIKLPDLTLEQAQELALRYGISWEDSNPAETALDQLMALVGGSPYRLALAYYALRTENLSLEQLLQATQDDGGIYQSHLEGLLLRLQVQSSLTQAFKAVIAANDPIELETTLAYKLSSLGLVTLNGNFVTPSCELYRQYFQTRLSGILQGNNPTELSFQSGIWEPPGAPQQISSQKSGLHDPEGLAVTMPLNSAWNKLAAWKSMQPKRGGWDTHLPRTQASSGELFGDVTSEVSSAQASPQENLLGGRYRVKSRLGSGGFGNTFLAEDTHRPSNPLCVVKKLANWFSPTELAIARRLFAVEAQTLEKLGEHPQIPRLLAYFEEAGEFYLVQEMITGQTLNQELLNYPSGWQDAEVMEFLEEILPVLDFVHQHQVIHRDLKPENIMRRESDGKLILIDFGVAKHLASAHQSAQTKTVIVGTQGYSPKEQHQGLPQTNSDLYAIGMIAIEAVTTFRPDQLQRDSHGNLLWRSSAPPTFNPWLAAVLDGLVQDNPVDRYQSAQEVLQDLHSMPQHHE